MDKDVTPLVSFEDNDSDCLPLTKCVCGATFKAWNFIVSTHREYAEECPKCGRKLYFSNNIRVYEVEE